MKVNYDSLQFLMMSVQAEITNYDYDASKAKWNIEPPFVRIKSDCYESVADNYILPEKKSTRGRKKKKVDLPKKFKSNISFVLRKHIHREVKKDTFTKTADKCCEHKGCEIISKDYNIRLFNKGKIVCVGVLHEDKSDFNECVQIVINFIIKRKMEEFVEYNFPPLIYSEMKKILIQRYQIININSTLENYQFSLNYNIDLYKLKDYFITGSQQIINIDYNKLYKFFADTCIVDNYNYSNEHLIAMLDQKNAARKHLVSRSMLSNILCQINLRIVNLNFAVFWKEFVITQGYEPINNIKYSFLKQYIIYYFKPFRRQLEMLEYALVESVIFKEPKNTLMVKKKIGNSDVNIRIFGTGNVNIQGGNSRDISLKAYDEIVYIFEENKYKILYTPDNPPMLSFLDILPIFPTEK